MRIIIEEVDHAYYQDIILTEDELALLKQSYMVEGSTLLKSRRINVGIRVGDKWCYKPPLYEKILEEEEKEAE
jgi:hypothetical protein